MGTVTLTLTLDVPRSEQFSDDELGQIIFDDVVNYVTISHMKDVMRWIVQTSKAENQGDERDAENCRAIQRHHELWAEILEAARPTMTISREG
jgi:hypothetical protein